MESTAEKYGGKYGDLCGRVVTAQTRPTGISADIQWILNPPDTTNRD